VLFWGHNPSTSWLTHATDAVAAQARGARLIVVDPRRAGLAVRADLWLRVRPGSDGALALGIAGVMIAEGWFDKDFICDWTNGPLLVRSDTGRLLTERDLSPHGGPERYLAWDQGAQRPVLYDPTTVSYDPPGRDLALFGHYQIATTLGAVECRPAFDLYAALCQRYTPDVVETITWVPRDQVRKAAHLLFVSRPVSYYVWTGVDQHTNATQSCRAIALLYTPSPVASTLLAATSCSPKCPHLTSPGKNTSPQPSAPKPWAYRHGRWAAAVRFGDLGRPLPCHP
jgi:anaerobic selenocysteine-containing dehydrogenase